MVLNLDLTKDLFARMFSEIPIIKVSATESTNSYAKFLLNAKKQASDFCVFTENQLEGKGQVGAKWLSEPSQNLSFSIVFQHLKLPVEDSFFISILASLIIKKVLHKYQLPQLRLKWPNDILSGRTKIGGVLIENNVQGAFVSSSIIGIGININQVNFPNLPKASSLKKISGTHYSIMEVLDALLREFCYFPMRLKTLQKEQLFESYLNGLFRLNKISTFQRPCGETFVGIIHSVSTDGKLIIRLEDEKEERFEVKEIKLLY